MIKNIIFISILLESRSYHWCQYFCAYISSHFNKTISANVINYYCGTKITTKGTNRANIVKCQYWAAVSTSAMGSPMWSYMKKQVLEKERTLRMLKIMQRSASGARVRIFKSWRLPVLLFYLKEDIWDNSLL